MGLFEPGVATPEKAIARGLQIGKRKETRIELGQGKSKFDRATLSRRKCGNGAIRAWGGDTGEGDPKVVSNENARLGPLQRVESLETQFGDVAVTRHQVDGGSPEGVKQCEPVDAGPAISAAAIAAWQVVQPVEAEVRKSGKIWPAVRVRRGGLSGGPGFFGQRSEIGVRYAVGRAKFARLAAIQPQGPVSDRLYVAHCMRNKEDTDSSRAQLLDFPQTALAECLI